MVAEGAARCRLSQADGGRSAALRRPLPLCGGPAKLGGSIVEGTESRRAPKALGRGGRTLLALVALYGAVCGAVALGYREFLYQVPHRGAYALPPEATVREIHAADGVPVHVMELP